MKLTIPTLALITSIVVGGCSSTSKSISLRQVNELTSSIMELENIMAESTQSVRAARTTLQKLVEQDYDDAVMTYKAFLTQVEECEAQAERLHECGEPMAKRSERYFDDWENSLEDFSNPKIRERSQSRLEGTKARYLSIVATLQQTHTKFAVYNASLRDHALFLSLDFNAASLMDVREDVQSLRDQAYDLEGAMKSTSDASEEYIRAATPPTK